MLFDSSTYTERRRILREKVGSGLILFFGNNNAPCNYPANGYTFRQDSSFLYFFGQERDGLVGIIDADSGQEWLLGDDIDIEDIIWTGFVPSVHDLAAQSGVGSSAPLAQLPIMLSKARGRGQKIHFLPPYRHDHMIQIADLMDMHPLQTRAAASVDLIKAVVSMRSIKSDAEVAEIERAMAIGYKMHTAAMKACRPGVTEKSIGGLMEGIAMTYGAKVSFNSIVSMHGEIFHGDPSLKPLETGRLLLVDAGAETVNNYCSDNTRTMPVSGKFTDRQRDIYSIVCACHDLTIEKARPGLKWMDMHLDVCRLMTDRLKDIGLMKGDTEEAVQAGAHAMFLQHGLGHMMGMDVHDMEGLGQIYVGFDDEVRPSDQFGTDCLRCGRRLQPGFVMTDEPGIYFIPALIDKWKAEKMHTEFINYDKLEEYRDFGGIRIEDDILITEDGCRVLGKDIIPYHPDDVEAFMAQ
ncbi:MAG: aminopeptidase P family protein [Bacteroidetes bacterium]|nr:aminopeptidase P family protein [Candidatus Colenecus caballi]